MEIASRAVWLEALDLPERMDDWIDTPDAPLSGLVLDWIEGEPPECLSRPVLAAVTGLVAALHRDHDLATREHLRVSNAISWLLQIGWRKLGPIDLSVIPG